MYVFLEQKLCASVVATGEQKQRNSSPSERVIKLCNPEDGSELQATYKRAEPYRRESSQKSRYGGKGSEDVGDHLCIFVDRHAVALGRVPLVHHAQERDVRLAKDVSLPIPASQRVTDCQLIVSAYTLQKAENMESHC